MKKLVLFPIVSVILFSIVAFISTFTLDSPKKDALITILYAILLIINILGLSTTNKLKKTIKLNNEDLKKVALCKIINIAFIIIQIPGIIVLVLNIYYFYL
ncbi:hypothetical protein [Clostridium sp. ATCC 25772]|uniref:hypothetical protein n=1 Tax=Clostridium sp. ATCC 25772 TaxID=1676991 RepID=UPI000784165C|nr:hypothetical protein [Clostridium sp. ATCC 25772]